jgi:cell division septal protein FtsQ
MALLKNKNQPRKPAGETRRRSPITTYYRSEPGTDTRSPFSKKPPPSKFRKYLLNFLDAVVIILLVAAVSYTLLIKPDANVLVSSTAFHNQKTYQAAASDQLSHFNNRNKITFNQQGMAEAMKKQFPEITDVQVELPIFSERPTIRLSVGNPSFIVTSQGQSYVVNSSGKAIAKTTELPPVKDLPRIDDQSGYKINTSAQILSSDDVTFINELIAQSRRAGVPIASLVLPAVAQEIDLRTKDQSYFVKFYLGGDSLAETGQFLAARKHFIDTKQPPSQYLDVRVAGKVFFK